MKNITLSADEQLIEDAREAARRQHTTLNDYRLEAGRIQDDRKSQGAAEAV